MASKPVLYIDGEAGTTGLEIVKRLQGRADIELLRVDQAKRRDIAERTRMLNSCDLAILCLPDDAARAAVDLITNPAVRVLDASTAHRTQAGWVYGFPELAKAQAEQIRMAKRVSNPGCYPTGALTLLRPLVDEGLVPPATGLTITAISGYSGGGKELIALCEKNDGNERAAAFCLYGLDLKHKHIPEIRQHSGLQTDPIFLPSYSGAFYRGMLVTIVLRLNELNAQTGKTASADEVQNCYATRYDGMKFIKVEPLQVHGDKSVVITPTTQNETNNVQVRVFSDEAKNNVILTACLDNLGKGASGAAVQNIELMLNLS